MKKITSPLPQKCSAWKKSSKKYKEKTKMKDNYFLSLSFWLIFHPLWSSGLKCSSKLKMWHLYISRFSTIKRCGFNGFTAENQCFKVIPPAKHIGGQIYNFVHKIKASVCLFVSLFDCLFVCLLVFFRLFVCVFVFWWSAFR